MLADASGIQQAFRYLLAGFLVVLPPLVFVYLRSSRLGPSRISRARP
jgi:hypothetical protein